MTTTAARPHDSLGEDYARPIPGLSADRRAAVPLLAGAAALAAAVVLALALGSVAIPLEHIAGMTLARLGVEVTAPWAATAPVIFWEIRLPRVILAGTVGAILALAGAVYQGVFRNPLADPYLIGVASGAGLGATIVIVSPVAASFYGFSALPAAAFAGAMLAVTFAYLLSRVGRTVPPATLILAGVAIAAFASSVTSLLMINSDENIRSVVAWLLGGFTVANWSQVFMVMPYAVAAIVIIAASARALNLLQLDEEQARLLGINVERTKILLLAVASLATAAAVSVSGLIGFVGLVVPHAVRLIVGPDHRILLPLSVLGGATFMILVDLVARTLFSVGELPVGIITALCGAPFFLYLLRRRRAVMLR